MLIYNNSRGSVRPGILVAFLTALVLMFSAGAMATVPIDPGESVELQPEDCATASGYKAPGGTSFNACPTGCLTACDLGQNVALASMELLLTAGSKFVTSTIYGQFTVSDPSNTGSVVDVTIDYDVIWEGLWTLKGLSTNYNDAKAEVRVILYDITNGSKVVKKTDPPIHTMKPNSILPIIPADGGVGADSGGTVNSLSAKVKRGHTYRLALTIHISAKGLLNAEITIDYFSIGQGLHWNEFVVTLSPDLQERIAELEERVTVLEEEIAELRSGLEHHTHTYLTGRGRGHNNTEAQTSEAIIMEDDNVPDSVLAWLPEGHPKLEGLPTKSAVLTNYPNPFNPTTTIQYSIPKASRVTIAVYNTLGQKVETLADGYRSAGEHTVELDASHLASGVYFYRLTTDQYAETRKLILLK